MAYGAMTIWDRIDTAVMPDLVPLAWLALVALVWFGCRMLRHPR